MRKQSIKKQSKKVLGTVSAIGTTLAMFSAGAIAGEGNLGETIDFSTQWIVADKDQGCGGEDGGCGGKEGGCGAHKKEVVEKKDGKAGVKKAKKKPAPVESEEASPEDKAD